MFDTSLDSKSGLGFSMAIAVQPSSKGNAPVVKANKNFSSLQTIKPEKNKV
jgi:hypothetical protein